jgi:hypothetical protein
MTLMWRNFPEYEPDENNIAGKKYEIIAALFNQGKIV